MQNYGKVLNPQNLFVTLQQINYTRIYMSKKLLIGISIAFMSLTAYAQGFESATQAVKNMKVGWNLGNTLDSNSGDVNNMWIEAYTGRTPSDYEKAWGQPITKPELIKMFKDAGFNTIRIPVTWYPHMEAKITSLKWDKEKNDFGKKIQETWMKRVHEIVDYVISQGMYCIVNIHHDTGTASTAWLRASEEVYDKEKDRFEAIWTQIAEEFKDYDEHLLFEAYNEMLDPYNSWCFASFGTSGRYNAKVAASAYNAINGFAQSFVNAVRATGGNNAKRNLIVNTYGSCSGGGTWDTHLKDPLKEMKYPNDEAGTGHIIFQVHTYPSLVKDDKVTNRTLKSIQDEVDDMIDAWKTYLVAKGAPVIVGEWGTSNVDAKLTDYDARRPLMLKFVEYFVQQCKQNDIATIYWMGLSDSDSRNVPKFNQPELKDAIIKGYYGEGGYSAVSPLIYKPVPDSPFFDLQGRRVTSPQKGIYIQNGKKYILK